MTREDSPSDDARDEPEDVGGFQFGVADGSGEPAEPGAKRAVGSGSGGSRFDFQSWLHENVPGLGEDRSGSSGRDEPREAPEATVGPADFVGFDFGRWLQETEPREPTTPDPVEAEAEAETASETDAVEAGAPAEAGAAATTHAGFDFQQWMADEDGETAPEEPPESARVVGGSSSADRSGLAGVLAALPFGGGTREDTYEGGFDFAGWLGEGDADLYEPVDVETARTATAEPAPTPEAGATAAAAGGGGFGETPEFPASPGGGISDTPPVKLAAFALFTAALVAVALTAAGAIAPLGPANGFASPAGGDGAQEQPVATNTSTPTPTEEPTPESTPEPTPTETATPEPTPEPTPTETATPTPEPTPTETATPTETENDSDDGDDGSILDPIIGGGSSSSSDDSLIDL